MHDHLNLSTETLKHNTDLSLCFSVFFCFNYFFFVIYFNSLNSSSYVLSFPH